MKIKFLAAWVCSLMMLSACAGLQASVSKTAQENLSKLLLGKDVKPLLDLPATKEGINVYVVPSHGGRLDERGIDMKELTKYLKSKGVGVQSGESDIITDVRFDKDRVEIHIGGGGEGRRGSKHANKVNAGLLRAGGSRINFRFDRNITDHDVQPKNFLPLMARVLDVSAIQEEQAEKQMPEEFKEAIDAKTVKEGMTYQMVLLSFGDPDEKKISDSSTSLSETWFYLKAGHRWVVDFTDGKVSNVRVY
jgi:hypothetical protein